MAMTTITASPMMVELPKPVEAPIIPKTTDTGSADIAVLSKAHDEPSAPVTKKTVETVSDAAVILREESPSGSTRQKTPVMEDLARTESTDVQAALPPRDREFPQTSEQPEKRSLSERRGRTLKRVDASPSPASVARLNDERKKAASERASAVAVEESGLAAQRKRGLSGLSLRKDPSSMPHTLPKNYYSDTEALKTSLRGGALTRPRRSRLPRASNPSETEYTLYLAGPNHDDRDGLGEKLFVGKLSDGQTGGELKQRVGCRLRTQLRPAEKDVTGMRVKEVAKSLEEMVLDIFFPDAVLRLEVMWDGVV